MPTIEKLFARDLTRRIEEVIKVDQAEEATVRQELSDYVVTEAIKEHFIDLYKAVADAKSEPHEGIGIWVSGFFGSGKSYFAKVLGYTVSNRQVGETTASRLFKENAKDTRISQYLDVINTQIPTHAIVFDVSMDRGVRTANERITEIMYKALLRELGYSEDFDLAELEISLEADGLLEQFEQEFEAVHRKPWKTRRKLGMAVNEASAVLHKMKPEVYSQADSWARSLGGGRADVTPNRLATRAFELASRRKPGHTLFFVIDEVGQYVSRSVEKMLDLQGVVQAFGVESKNRVSARQAVAPCWICVTSQEKLNEVVGALDSKKIELARLQDRFPCTVDLKQSDIAEITGRRVLDKTKEAEEILGRLYDAHEGRLKTFCSLEKTSRNIALTREDFIKLYPYLPYQIELSIDIVSGLRLKRGAQRHIGGSNRTLIKQAEQMLKNPRTNLAGKEIGKLVTLDLVYELLYLGNLLPTELTRQVDEVPNRFPNSPMAGKVAKAIALLEVVTDLPRTAGNIAAVLHPSIEAESQRPQVDQALQVLQEGQIVRESEDGYKLLSVEEKDWESERRGLDPKPADRNRIRRELVKEILTDPQIRNFQYQGKKTFRFSLTVDGTPIETDGPILLNIRLAEDNEDLAEQVQDLRQQSNEKPKELFWITALNEEIHKQVDELYRSQEMVSLHERDAAQGKLRGEQTALFAEEKVRRDRIRRDVRQEISAVLQAGQGFFRAVQKDGSAQGRTLAEVLHKFTAEAIPSLYPKLELGTRKLKGDEVEKFLTAVNLDGLPSLFYSGENGLHLVTKQQNRYVPNLGAEICKEILEYLQREHSYGNRITGKIIEKHFEGIGYGWDREIVRLVLAVLLRGGAIEVTHQGRKYRHLGDPVAREVFTHLNAFRAASFAPRKALGLKTLGVAVRAYERITGKEVDVEESAIAQAFQDLARKDREMILPLLASMKAQELPGVTSMEGRLKSIEGILEMAPDDCVKTLAGEGQDYEAQRKKILRLTELLTGENLALIRKARAVLLRQWPVLQQHDANGDLEASAKEIEETIAAEDFYEHLEAIRLAAEKISEKYEELYSDLHRKRLERYIQAVDEIKGLPEWAIAEGSFPPEQVSSVITPLLSKACSKLSKRSPEESACRNCAASVAQLEADISAADALKSEAVQRLVELVTPEQEVRRVRVSEFVSGTMQSAEDVERAVAELQQRLLKLVAEGIHVILE